MSKQRVCTVWGGQHGDLEAVMLVVEDEELGGEDVLSVDLRRNDGVLLSDDDLGEELLDDILGQLLSHVRGYGQ